MEIAPLGHRQHERLNGVVIVAYLLEPLRHLLLDRAVWTAAITTGAAITAGAAVTAVTAVTAGAAVTAVTAGAAFTTLAAGPASAGAAGARVRIVRARRDREKKAKEKWNEVSVVHFSFSDACERRTNSA
ncbi:MAG TPA: hypothetical protein VL242_39850 [Sorangium sp.]|nr:hypothetical protein [Sorangium sp.]